MYEYISQPCVTFKHFAFKVESNTSLKVKTGTGLRVISLQLISIRGP